jgi:hypothetical protein
VRFLRNDFVRTTTHHYHRRFSHKTKLNRDHVVCALDDRLPPFLILLVILEEIIPLLVIYAPSILPSTCILPSQMQKIREKTEERHMRWLDVLRKSESRRKRWQSLVSRVEGEGRSLRLRELGGEDVRILCGRVSLLSFWIRYPADIQIRPPVSSDYPPRGQTSFSVHELEDTCV